MSGVLSPASRVIVDHLQQHGAATCYNLRGALAGNAVIATALGTGTPFTEAWLRKRLLNLVALGWVGRTGRLGDTYWHAQPARPLPAPSPARAAAPSAPPLPDALMPDADEPPAAVVQPRRPDTMTAPPYQPGWTSMRPGAMAFLAVPSLQDGARVPYNGIRATALPGGWSKGGAA